MSVHPDQDHMSPDQRRDELAAILATGVLRLRSRLHLAAATSQKLREVSHIRLDLPAGSCPDGEHG